MLNLATTPDFSAARYDVRGSDPAATIDIMRLPYQSKLASLTPTMDLWWRVAVAYFRVGSDFVFAGPLAQPGGVNTRWTAYSGTGGIFASVALGNGFSLEPGVDVSLAHLDNGASYWGVALPLAPRLNNALFNWDTNAWLIAPNMALQWSDISPERRVRVRAHAAWAWIDSFSESSDVIAFRETAGSWSLRGEYAAPLGVQIFERPLDWVAIGRYAGFFGANRDALGFTTVAELGLGIEALLRAGGTEGDRVRVSSGYLFGPGVRGWSIGVGLDF